MGKRVELSKIVLISLFVIFTLVLLLLAFKFRMGLSPDSYYHLDLSRAYSTTMGIPPNTPDTYQWRDITRIAYLYFWINGRVLNINNVFFNDVLLLRLLNVIYSCATVYMMYLLSKELIKGKWKQMLPLFFLVNTLMFVFLSASINYDNLANLLSFLSIYFFVKFVKSKICIKYLLLMILALTIGALTKYTILPLAFVLVLLCSIDIIKKRKVLKKIKVGKEMLLVLPILFFGILNISLYGTNLLKYKGLEPNCEQILTHEQCLQNGVYYRDNVTRQPIEIEGIGHIFKLVINNERVDPVRYFLKWVPNITMKIYGIMADNSLYMPKEFKYIYIFFFSISLLLSIIYKKKWDKIDKYLIAILLFYTSVLFFVQNYSMYLRFNHYYLALQGRYMFPVIGIVYILFTKSIFFLEKKWLRYIILVPLILLFLYGCYIFFFLNIPSLWWEEYVEIRTRIY